MRSETRAKRALARAFITHLVGADVEAAVGAQLLAAACEQARDATLLTRDAVRVEERDRMPVEDGIALGREAVSARAVAVAVSGRCAARVSEKKIVRRGRGGGARWAGAPLAARGFTHHATAP